MPEYVDTLICDAIRPEANNKATLLGLLGESIFVPAIPTQLASLGIMQRWRPLPGDAPGSSFQFSFELQGPGGQPRIPIPPQPLVVPGGPSRSLEPCSADPGIPCTRRGGLHDHDDY